ncbi:MAG: prephenate dehydratase [Deltaproteobacteria bacterium]|nr:prephenate dehydratase [Deltaproteobacteria bacterium]MBN2671086.1 prephenate dehydratase [Deltaproteobacteria bacterium]
MKLQRIREAIDKTDRELVSLLAKRMELGLRTRPYKKDTLDTSREKAVLERADKARLGLLESEFIQKTFKAIMAESKRLQNEDLSLVAFQGEHGAYSEIASRKLMPTQAAYIPCNRFSEVFEGVTDGGFDIGIVPVENSLEGAVTQVNNLLTQTNLKVVGETVVPIDHCLLARPGSDHREIKAVYSHPQALGQCSGFLERNNLEPRPYYDTAGAAKMLIDEDMNAAAIASPLCAEIYGLEILKEHIEDDASNQTRFLMLSKNAYAGEGDKCSLVFSTTHEAGKLFEVLQVFANAKVNLTRIASMPHREDQGNYNFFLDFEGNQNDPKISAVIDAVAHHSKNLNFLGCYPSAAKLT